jgi:hypothetical protein
MLTAATSPLPPRTAIARCGLSPFDPVAFVAHAALRPVSFREVRYDEAASHYA